MVVATEVADLLLERADELAEQRVPCGCRVDPRLRCASDATTGAATDAESFKTDRTFGMVLSSSFGELEHVLPPPVPTRLCATAVRCSGRVT